LVFSLQIALADHFNTMSANDPLAIEDTANSRDAYIKRRAMAKLYRSVVFLALFTLVAIALNFATAFAVEQFAWRNEFHQCALLLLIATHFCLFLRACQLKMRLGGGSLLFLLFTICMLIPPFNLVALLHLSYETITVLRSTGLKIGIMGVREKDYDRRYSPWHCMQCDYDLTGNRSGTCPECGHRIPASMRPILAERETTMLGAEQA